MNSRATIQPSPAFRNSLNTMVQVRTSALREAWPALRKIELQLWEGLEKLRRQTVVLKTALVEPFGSGLGPNLNDRAPPRSTWHARKRVRAGPAFTRGQISRESAARFRARGRAARLGPRDAADAATLHRANLEQLPTVRSRVARRKEVRLGWGATITHGATRNSLHVRL